MPTEATTTKVFKQYTTGVVHKRKNCCVTSRTRLFHAEMQMTNADLATAKKCERCW